MRQLPEEQRIVLESQYAMPLRVPLDEVGIELSRCKSTIYRIKRKALRNIWELFVAQGVPLFWDDKLEHMCYNNDQQEE